MSEPTLTPESHPQPGHESLEQRLQKHPELRAKLEELLKIVENRDGQIELADLAEQRVLDELRGIGQEALRGWATRQEQKKRAELRALNPAARKERKKSSTGTPDWE